MNGKWVIRLLIIALGSGACAGASAQSGAPERIQAVLNGALSGHLARSLSDRLAARPGVLLCRVDPASHNLLLHVDASFGMSAAGLEQFFRVHGLMLRCLQRGAIDVPFSVLDPRACTDEDVHR